MAWERVGAGSPGGHAPPKHQKAVRSFGLCPRRPAADPEILARVIHEGSWRGRADGPYDGHPQGRESETVLPARPQGAMAEDARQKAQIRGPSRNPLGNED